MPRFTYRAKDHALQVIEGTIEAESESAAINRLGSEGMFPITIIEVGTIAASPLGRFAPRISQRTLAYTTHQLADLLGGGLPLLSALMLLGKQTEQPTFRRVIESLADAVRDGQSLSEAMSAHPRMFPALYRSMIRAGEAGGGLEHALTRLAEMGEHEAELKSRLVNAAAYPVFVLCVAVLMTGFLMTFVIPKLSLVLIENNQVLPLPTRLLLGVSHAVTRGWWELLLLVMVAAWGLMRWYASPMGKRIVDRTLLMIPAVGTLVRKAETARFTRNLGMMVGQGVPILQALAMVAKNLANAAVQASIEQIHDAVREGSSLAAALSATGQFPVFVSNMVAVGEESGTVDAALLKVASAYERDVDRTLGMLTAVLEPVLLLVVGGIVMLIVLAMLLPVFQIGLGVQ